MRGCMGIAEIKSALSHIPGIDSLRMSYGTDGKTKKQIFTLNGNSVTVDPSATNSEIAAALQPMWLAKLNAEQPSPVTKQIAEKPMSITGYQPGAIQQRLAALKAKNQDQRTAVLAKLDAAAAKGDEVNAQISKIADQASKEADDALQEFAQFTNGAPN